MVLVNGVERGQELAQSRLWHQLSHIDATVSMVSETNRLSGAGWHQMTSVCHCDLVLVLCASGAGSLSSHTILGQHGGSGLKANITESWLLLPPELVNASFFIIPQSLFNDWPAVWNDGASLLMATWQSDTVRQGGR